MPSDPSPAEDAAARTKEAEEQAALPYKWNQTIAELDVTFTVPGNFKSRDLVVEIKKQSIAAGIKGQDPIIKVRDHVFHLAPHVSQLLRAFSKGSKAGRFGQPRIANCTNS